MQRHVIVDANVHHICLSTDVLVTFSTKKFIFASCNLFCKCRFMGTLVNF